MLSTTNSSIAAHLVIYLIFSFLIYEKISLFNTLFLLSVHTFFLFLRYILGYIYTKVKETIVDDTSINNWLLYTRISVFTTGFTWSLNFFFIGDISPEYHFILFAIIIGLAGGGLLTLGINLDSYLFFMLPILVIPAVWMLFQGDIPHMVTSLILMMGVVYNILIARRSSQDFEDLITEKEKNELQKNILHYQANHDALTKLPNRFLFLDRLDKGIKSAKREKSKLALLFIDLDRFKEINDSLGHEIGDEVLKIVTQNLSTMMRQDDTLARLGGDEFTVIMENLKQGQNAAVLAEKILHEVEKPIQIKGYTLHISSSIGISLYPEDGTLAQDLLKYADSAMYKAKGEGRNNFQFYSADMTELAFERVVMEASLRNALKENQFIVHYQPQIDGRTDKLIGIEALVRWVHPTMGLVSPAKFIPLAESTGLIVELDRQVMKIAMAQVAKWYKDGLNPGKLAMNLSVKQLQQKDFIQMCENLMQETACKVEWIELEVTEGQIMTNPQKAISVLQEISDMGIKLAVDDFGTGYSSLAYLKKLPINKLKIDQSFVRGLPDDAEDAGIARSIIALAKSLNLEVIAEGVETEEQKDFFVQNGCVNIQGYYYSKPLSTDELETFLS